MGGNGVMVSLGIHTTSRGVLLHVRQIHGRTIGIMTIIHTTFHTLLTTTITKLRFCICTTMIITFLLTWHLCDFLSLGLSRLVLPVGSGHCRLSTPSFFLGSFVLLL